MLLLFFFAFLSGVVTIFAPCIWPLLPIILSASVSGGQRKPFGIVTGIAVSFTIFTLSLSYILKVIPFDPDSLRLFGVVVIAFLGVVLVVPALGKRLEGVVSRFSGLGGRFISQDGTGFGSGFITGFALGVVWSPCAGPILATVATLAATQSVNIVVVFITLFFVAGVAVPLYIFSAVGQKLLVKTRAFSRYTGRIQQVFGVIMILAALAIYTGYDRVLQTKLLDAFPGYSTFLNQFEDNEAVKKELDKLQNKKEDPTLMEQVTKKSQNVLAGLGNHGRAPEFAGIEHWLNTEDGKPLTMAGLRGKVVLVDFWTYSCINCIRTLPYVTAWYEKYKDQGLVVVGVHTPEFEFEKKTSNVVAAIERYGITYPVAQDNSFQTWRAYNNRYWPAHYLIDVEGNVREYHFGEGGYAETEAAIQALLEEAGQNVNSGIIAPQASNQSANIQTPETYLGSGRLERLVSPERITGAPQTLSVPEKIPLDSFGYGGVWRVEGERAVSGDGARLKLHFQGEKVFLVMAPEISGESKTVTVLLDGQPIALTVAGKDLSNGQVTVDQDRLYELVDLQGQGGEHFLELQFETPGTAVYAFTFS